MLLSNVECRTSREVGRTMCEVNSMPCKSAHGRSNVAWVALFRFPAGFLDPSLFLPLFLLLPFVLFFPFSHIWVFYFLQGGSSGGIVLVQYRQP